MIQILNNTPAPFEVCSSLAPLPSLSYSQFQLEIKLGDKVSSWLEHGTGKYFWPKFLWPQLGTWETQAWTSHNSLRNDEMNLPLAVLSFPLFPCSWLSFYQHCLNTVWLTENSVSKYWHNVKISHLLFAEIDNNRSFLKLVTEIKQSSKTPISFQARKKQLELAASQGGMWCRSEAVRGPEVSSRPSAPHCGHSENLASDPRHPNTGPWPGDIRPGHSSLWKW